MIDKQSLSIAINAAMVVVWVLYLHLFLVQHRRRLRPLFVIHHAQDRSAKSLCLLVNMSQEPVHVERVMATVEHACGTAKSDITSHQTVGPEVDDVRPVVRQGPLQPGEYLRLGRFEDIILDSLATAAPESREGGAQSALVRSVTKVKICVALIHGPSKHPVGACRSFALEDERGDVSVRALQVDTQQLVSRRDKRSVRRWLEEGL